MGRIFCNIVIFFLMLVSYCNATEYLVPKGTVIYNIENSNIVPQIRYTNPTVYHSIIKTFRCTVFTTNSLPKEFVYVYITGEYIIVRKTDIMKLEQVP